MSSGKFYLIPDVEFVWINEVDDPVAIFNGKEVNAYDLEEYLDGRFTAWAKLNERSSPKPNDFFNFVHTHAPLVRDYIEKHGV